MWGFAEEFREGRPGLLSESDPRVVQVQEQLKYNSAAVLKLDAEPQTILSALWHINYRLRQDKRIFRKPPKAFSWGCIRVADNERSTSFWRELWDVIGAPQEKFARLLASITPTDAAKTVMSVLNCFVPPSWKQAGWRAPEVLVIIGTERFSKVVDALGGEKSWPLNAPAVLDELRRAKLLPSHDMEPVLGSTRVILVECDKLVGEDTLVDYSGKDMTILQALATFRWGFTQQMASVLLSSLESVGELDTPKGSALHRRLQRWVDQKLLRYGQGRYHLPEQLRNELDSRNAKLTRKQRASRHFAAGLALAPYTSKARTSGLAFDVAFLSENVQAAKQHFREAHALAEKRQIYIQRHQPTLDTQVWNCLGDISRFAEVPYWDVIIDLNRGRNDPLSTWMLGNELVDSCVDNVGWCPASHIANVIKSGIQYLNAFPRGDEEEAREVRGRMEELHQLAQRYCEATEYEPEDHDHLLLINSLWAWYLMEYQADREEEISLLNAEVWRLIEMEQADPKVTWGSWFERVADREPRHEVAAAIYARAVQAGVRWWQLWVKGVGAEIRGRTPERPIRDRLLDMPVSNKRPRPLRQSADECSIGDILAKSQKGAQTVADGKETRKHVLERWQSGARFFHSRFSNNPDLQELLRPYRFLLGSSSSR
jgi:hypothetical protein